MSFPVRRRSWLIQPDQKPRAKRTAPLIPYYGGKQRIAKRIVDLLPRHTVYAEPFAGGAAVMFAKPWPPATNNNDYREMLNDTDSRIINLYRVARERHDDLERTLQLWPYSREEHKRAKLLIDDADADPVERAAAVVVQCAQSFASVIGKGWGFGVFSRNSAATWSAKMAVVSEQLSRLHGVHVEHDDALNVIDRWDSPQTLFYCDPPYVGTSQGHYAGYTQEDLDALIDKLSKCTGSFVMSGYENASYPDAWERFELSTSNASSCKGKTGKGRDKARAATPEETGKAERKRTEVVLRIDRSDNARVECHDIWRKWAAAGFQWGGDKRDYGV